MKKLFVFALLTIMLVIPLFANADDPPWPVAGKTAILDHEGSVYQLVFQSGPFGPRDNGHATISRDGVLWKILPYMEGPLWIVTIEDFGKFKYTYGELTWIQGPLIVFDITEPNPPG